MTNIQLRVNMAPHHILLICTRTKSVQNAHLLKAVKKTHLLITDDLKVIFVQNPTLLKYTCL